MKTIKVLGFDNWTGGARHFEQLLSEMTSSGMSLTLLHLGSWGNDPGRPESEKIGDLDVRDISYYRNKSFEQIIEIENPDAVLMFSTKLFAHRAFLRYCKQKNIPTLHCYHGVVTIQNITISNGGYRINPLTYARYVLSKFKKIVKHTLPCYMKALWVTNANVNDWLRFILDIYWLLRGRPLLKAAEDAKTDKGAVYIQADVDHAINTYGFKLEDVYVIGNPDLVHFGFRAEMLGKKILESGIGDDYVIYLDTGLVAHSLQFNSPLDFVAHLKHTIKELAIQGKRLGFKPHPANDIEFIKSCFLGFEHEIEIITNDQFINRLDYACACIVEPSTLALIPALLGMPVMLANYGDLNSIRFGSVLEAYPRGQHLMDISKFNQVLDGINVSQDQQKLVNWITFHAGPFPAEAGPQRVVEIIKSMVSDRRHNKRL